MGKFIYKLLVKIKHKMDKKMAIEEMKEYFQKELKDIEQEYNVLSQLISELGKDYENKKRERTRLDEKMNSIKEALKVVGEKK